MSEYLDGLYEMAKMFATRDKASTSYLQRRMQISYSTAASLMERMENDGLVSARNHAGIRTIMVPWKELTMTDTDELKRLAEADVKSFDRFVRQYGGLRQRMFWNDILALIAENEWLTRHSEDRERMKSERDDAMCIIRGLCSGMMPLSDAFEFLARIDAAE